MWKTFNEFQIFERSQYFSPDLTEDSLLIKFQKKVE